MSATETATCACCGLKFERPAHDKGHKNAACYECRMRCAMRSGRYAANHRPVPEARLP